MRLSRPVRVGIYGSAAYLCIATLLFIVTWVYTKPDNVGLDWIPFVTLTMPWYLLNPSLLFPGVILNAGILFLLGVLVEIIRQRNLRR